MAEVFNPTETRHLKKQINMEWTEAKKVKPEEMVPWWEERDLNDIVQMLATWAIKVKMTSTGGIASDQDHQQALQIARRVAQMTPDHVPSLTREYRRVQNSFLYSTQRADILRAIDGYVRQARQEANLAVSRTHSNSISEGPTSLPPQRALVKAIDGLSVWLVELSWWTLSSEDLEESIRELRRALALTRDDDDVAGLVHRMQVLSEQLTRLYGWKGRVEDLNEAILMSRRAMNLTTEGDPRRVRQMVHLAQQLAIRGEEVGQTDDLYEAHELARIVLKILPKDSPELAGWLSGLGDVLARWARREGVDLDASEDSNDGKTDDDREFSERDEAIYMLQEAVRLTEIHDPRLPTRLVNLATYLTARCRSTWRLKGIEEAIGAARSAVNLICDGNPDLVRALTALAKAIYMRYCLPGGCDPDDSDTEDTRELDDAETKVRMAIRIAPKDFPGLADAYILGGEMAMTREDETIGDSYESADYHLHAFRCKSARPLTRIHAVRYAIRDELLWRFHHKSREVAEASVELLLTVCSRYASRREQLSAVSKTSGFAADVCSILLDAKNDDPEPEKALECLEQGRGLVIGYVTQGRSEISILRQKYPTKAQELERLQHALSLSIDKTVNVLSQQRLLIEREDATLQIEPFLAGIRSLPEHRRFLLPPSLQELKDTASEGPIVIVNVTELSSPSAIIRSSAALIIRPSPWPVKYIPLPSLDGHEVERFRPFALTGPRSRSRYIGAEEPEATSDDFLVFLESLWTNCVLPILQELQYYPPRSGGGDLPRIWWMGTGLASSVPFHAAGRHTTGSVENTYSCAISSYTPSLKSLRYVRDQGNKMPDQLTTLLVAMPTTPRADDLPGVARESSVIEDIMNPVRTLKHPDSATVLEALNEFSIAHFACHGCSDTTNPARSYLALQRQDGDSLVPDKLTLQSIIDAQLSRVWLAYLSACSTAENRVRDFADEALHLASGFQTAGFKHTIAAMWASDDDICARVARVFYDSLMIMKRGKFNDENRAVAVALHQAVNQVRLEYLDQPYLWAQYIHFGA
jgi:hypothetical protein